MATRRGGSHWGPRQLGGPMMGVSGELVMTVTVPNGGLDTGVSRSPRRIDQPVA